MKINDYFQDSFGRIVTIPDCFVARANKIGGGNGEAKLYIGGKEEVESFFDVSANGNRKIPFLMLKDDLNSYMEAASLEYLKPSQQYEHLKDIPKYFYERKRKIEGLPEEINFCAEYQGQIAGPRGYINSPDKNYSLLREIALPLISYLTIFKLKINDEYKYYLRLFVDFDRIKEVKNGPLVYKYGTDSGSNKGACSGFEYSVPEEKVEKKRKYRDGQTQYRQKLIEECIFCPFTLVSDDRLLVASHIKPWVVSNEKERVDPKNGFLLTPLYDKLFDQGYITFDDSKHMHVSHVLSKSTCSKLNLEENKYIDRLPLDEQRKKYLDYHRRYVFKG